MKRVFLFAYINKSILDNATVVTGKVVFTHVKWEKIRVYSIIMCNKEVNSGTLFITALLMLGLSFALFYPQ